MLGDEVRARPWLGGRVLEPAWHAGEKRAGLCLPTAHESCQTGG